MKRNLFGAVTCLLLLIVPHVAAQEPPAENPSSAETVEKTAAPKIDPDWQLKLKTPQTCFNTFMVAASEGAWDDAVRCMDFSGFTDQGAAAAVGQTLVYRLRYMLESVLLDADSISDDAEFDGTLDVSEFVTGLSDGTPLDQAAKNDIQQIALTRDPTDQLWRFSAGTVVSIEGMWPRWQPDPGEPVESDQPKPFQVWLGDQFPALLRSTHLLIPDYMWICLLAVVVLGLLADSIVGFLAIHLTQAFLKVSPSDKKDAASRRLWKPVGLLVQALVWYYGTKLIGLPIHLTSMLLIGLKFFTVVAGVWVGFRLIDVASGYLGGRAKLTASRFDDLLVPLVSKSLKTLAIVFGILICADVFDLPITGFLGGLGLGGVALALASKDAISNLFGSFTVLIDRPFEIGDWVITEKIEGTVETVGFRSTRIRTFYNSVVTLPNSRLTTAIVDNMGRRRYRRVKAVIGVQYNTTPEQIDAFCEGIRELIRRNACTRKDYFHVYFNNFSDSSLDILLYFFLRVPDWSTELRERHRLFTEILRLAQELKVSFAFPTRTLHLDSDQTLPSPHELPHSDAERIGKESAARIVEHLQGNGRDNADRQ